jgi:hypothetical protein
MGWGDTATHEEKIMKKLVLTSACILALSTAGALAQSSQGKAGSDNGPTSNSVTTNGSAHTGSGVVRPMPNTTTGAAGSARGDTSSEGNVGPGTSNNTAKQPGGR